eukprot:327503-Prymnesium_polylepis.2
MRAGRHAYYFLPRLLCPRSGLAHRGHRQAAVDQGGGGRCSFCRLVSEEAWLTVRRIFMLPSEAWSEGGACPLPRYTFRIPLLDVPSCPAQPICFASGRRVANVCTHQIVNEEAWRGGKEGAS